MKLMINYIINIPFDIKLIFWKNNYDNTIKICLLNKSKKLILIFSKNKIRIDKWTNSLIIFKDFSCFDKDILSQNKINNLLNSWGKFYYNKIKFKGKGFRIKFFKKIKLIKLFFGKSHKTFFFLKNIKKKRINKYKFILYGLNKNKIINISKKIINIKKINFYTLRGLRLSKQTIYKRKGKKGTYI